MHEYDESSSNRVRLQQSPCDCSSDTTALRRPTDFVSSTSQESYNRMEYMPSQLTDMAPIMHTNRRRKYTTFHANGILIYVASVLALLKMSYIPSTILSVSAAAFVTSSTSVSGRNVGHTLPNAGPFMMPYQLKSKKRMYPKNMVVSDPTESTRDTTATMALPDMPLLNNDDGIYAITTPEEHNALMQYAEKHQQLVILKVFAPWCRACKGLESKFVQISREPEYAPSASLPIIYASLSIQHNKAFVQSLGVLALPTIQFYVAGQLIDTFPCGPSKVPILRRKLTQLINDHVDPTTGCIKAMEQVAVLAEETAASIAAAASKRQSTSNTATTETDETSEVNGSNVVSAKKQDDVSTQLVLTAKDREMFEKIPYFKGISLADFDQILSKVVPLTFQPGSIIVREGKPGRTFYIIQEGEVEICQKTTNQRVEPILTSDPMVQPSVVSKSNNLFIGSVINRLGPGDFFGERSLITGEPRAASLRVAESGPVTVWAFDKDIFPFSCVLSGKSRNTGGLSSKSNTQFMDQVNTKYGVGLNADVLDDTDESSLQQIIEEYQQHILDKQLYEASTASQIRGSIHKPQPIPDVDVDAPNVVSGVVPIPAETISSDTNAISDNTNDAIFSLLSRFQMIRHVSRCFRYIQESKTMLKWGDVGSRTRRNMLVQRLSKSRQMEYDDIFHIMDINKDGCIEVYELQQLMDSIGEPLHVHESLLQTNSDCSDPKSANNAMNIDTCVSQGGMTYEDFMGLMAEAEFYYLFRDIFASLDGEDSGYVKAGDLDRVLCGVRDLISDDRKSVIDVEDKDMLIDYEQFSRMLLGTTLL
jgi:calmodulin